MKPSPGLDPVHAAAAAFAAQSSGAGKNGAMPTEFDRQRSRKRLAPAEARSPMSR